MKNNLHRIILISAIIVINVILFLILGTSIKDAIIELKNGQQNNQISKETRKEANQNENNRKYYRSS